MNTTRPPGREVSRPRYAEGDGDLGGSKGDQERNVDANTTQARGDEGAPLPIWCGRPGSGQAYAFGQLQEYYARCSEGWKVAGVEAFRPANFSSMLEKDPTIRGVLLLGGLVVWRRAAGYKHSYTQNWPFDPLAGNNPRRPGFWSAVGVFILILAIGISSMLRKLDMQEVAEQQRSRMPPLAQACRGPFKPTPTQRATYKFLRSRRCSSSSRCSLVC